MSESQVWFITGASSGFGKAIATKAIAEGNFVIVTSRNEADLLELVALAPSRVVAFSLDVTRINNINQVVHDALLWQGKIDVLVNNAGRGEIGSAEDTPDSWLRDIFDLHVFGPAALTRAVLPGMRSHKKGTIVQMSSYGGKVAVAGFSSYCSSKFALEGYSEALADEVSPLGIKVIIVQPGAFGTGFFGPRLRVGSYSDEYEETVGATKNMLAGFSNQKLLDPRVAAERIYIAVVSDKSPLHLPLGDDAVAGLRNNFQSNLNELDRWTALSTGLIE